MSTPKAPNLAVLPMADNETSAARPQILQPSGWPAPKGYANGMAADGGATVWANPQPGIDSTIPQMSAVRRNLCLKRSTIVAIGKGGITRPPDLRM